MELTKINVIKIMEEEQKNQELFNTNLGKKAYMNSMYKFIDTYIEPKLRKKLNELNLEAPQELIEKLTKEVENDTTISEKDKQTMLKIDTINLYYTELVFDDLIRELTNIVNTLGLIDKDSNIIKEELDEDMANFLTEDEYGFLGKDKKTKERVANKIIEKTMAMFK